MKITWIILLLSLWLLPQVVLANPNQCFNPDWTVSKYTHLTRGEVVIYKSPIDYKITATNLACITAVEVLQRRKNMPSKMLVGLISEDYRQAFIAQWSFVDDRFTIIEVSIPIQEFRTKGMFITFPEPLLRLREVMVAQKFPAVDDLPAHLQHKYKVNYVPTSLMQLKSIALGE